MSTADLSPFQSLAERRITDLLAKKGVALREREVLHGSIPFYSKDAQTVVRLTFADSEVWLFEDDAVMSADNHEHRLERPAYDSAEALLADLLTRVEAVSATHDDH